MINKISKIGVELLLGWLIFETSLDRQSAATYPQQLTQPRMRKRTQKLTERGLLTGTGFPGKSRKLFANFMVL
jgi:hypothetical protein